MNQIDAHILLLICIFCSEAMKTWPPKAILFIMSIQLRFGLTQSFWEFLILAGEGKATQQGIAEVTHYP